MKTYKKNEIKDIFEKNAQNIIVSEELKSKTLKNIPKHSISTLYWVRNCAAVLVVSCLCLTLYIHKSPYFNKSNSNEIILQNTSIESEETESLAAPRDLLRSAPTTMMKKSSPDNAIPQKSNLNYSILPSSQQEKSLQNALPAYDTANANDHTSTEPVFYGTATQENSENIIDKLQIGNTEQDLLNYYPDIEKCEKGYYLTINNQTILYEIANGSISNILITN